MEGQDLVARDALQLELGLLALICVFQGLVVNELDAVDLFDATGLPLVVLKKLINDILLTQLKPDN